MLLDIQHKETRPGVIVIAMTGKVMLGPESQKLELLIPQLLREGHRNFIFDLTGVSHLDSTGIGRFIFSFNKVRQAGGQLYMAGATGHVRDVFRVTRLDTIFRFCLDVDAAHDALGVPK